ncbi:hypothetical protein DL89DRAFT_264989, partial [Linderina pennispora]
MVQLPLASSLLAVLALQARASADSSFPTSTEPSDIGVEMSSSTELGDISTDESPTAVYSHPPIFYPWGFMADASYNFKLDLAKTKSDGGAVNYGIEVGGACAQYTPEPRTITYTRYEFSEPYWMARSDDAGDDDRDNDRDNDGDNDGYDSDHGDLDSYSAQVFTTVFTPRFPQVGCSGVYKAEYSDSNSQYESSDAYASKYPDELLLEPLLALGENGFLGSLDCELGASATDSLDDIDSDVDFDEVDVGQFFSTLAAAAEGEATIAHASDNGNDDVNGNGSDDFAVATDNFRGGNVVDDADTDY